MIKSSNGPCLDPLNYDLLSVCYIDNLTHDIMYSAILGRFLRIQMTMLA